MQGGRVIDAVAHESHHVPSPLQREKDPVLLRWRDAREHGRLLRQVTERRVVDPCEVIARHDLLLIEPDGSADVTRDPFVVASQDFDCNAVALEVRQHPGDVRQDGIGEADEARQHEIGLVVARIGGARLQPAVGDRQDAQTVLAHVLVDCGTRLPGRRVERPDLTSRFERDRPLDDRLGRTFGDEEPATAAVRRLHHHRQAAPLEIERDFVDLLIARHVGRGLLKNGGVQRTPDAGLETAVDGGQRQRPRRCRTGRIDGPIELHHATRQRARLVAAQDVDAAEVLNGREMFDDYLIARHPQRAPRERDGADHRQELGRETDAQRHGKEQRLECVVLERDAHQQDEEHQHDRRPKNQQTESPQSVFELRFRDAAPQPHRDVTEHRLRARGGRHGRAGAAHDRGAEEHQMGRVGVGRAVRRGSGGCLVGGQ